MKTLLVTIIGSGNIPDCVPLLEAAVHAALPESFEFCGTDLKTLPFSIRFGKEGAGAAAMNQAFYGIGTMGNKTASNPAGYVKLSIGISGYFTKVEKRTAFAPVATAIVSSGTNGQGRNPGASLPQADGCGEKIVLPDATLEGVSKRWLGRCHSSKEPFNTDANGDSVKALSEGWCAEVSRSCREEGTESLIFQSYAEAVAGALHAIRPHLILG